MGKSLSRARVAGKAAAGKGKAGEGPADASKITSFLLDKGAAAGAGAGGTTPSTRLKPDAPLDGCSSQHAAAVPYGELPLQALVLVLAVARRS